MLIGIDVGTTAVKVSLFDLAGRQIEAFDQPHPTTRTSPGYAEQNPETWVGNIRKALAEISDRHDANVIKAIGICAQVNTHVFVDGQGNALTPAITWQDGRCGDAAAELDAGISTEDKIKWWGAPLPVDASHCLARMKWMRDHHREIWKQIRWVMLPKDYCLMKLTGKVVSDPISNVGFVDNTLNRIPQLLDLVPGAADRLVPLGRIDDIAGTITPGFPLAGTPVCVGTMDAWAGMFGLGVHEPGQAMYLSGTSEILGVVSPRVVPTPGIIVFPAYDDLRLHAGPTQMGGASVKWYCNAFGTTPARMATEVEALDFSRPCPLFLPHMQGERAPLWDADARGAFLGIDASTGAAEFARGVYEGVAFSARLLFETLESSAGARFNALNCGGGGFQSGIWNQIRADVLGRPLRRLAVRDPGVLGAAGIAAVACGENDTIRNALAHIVHFDTIYEPNLQMTERYNRGFELFKDAYAANKSINKNGLKYTGED